MSKLLYSATMSLDGFIAGHGGDMSWLTTHLGADPGVPKLMDAIGALLIGRATFDGDDPNRGTDKEGAFGGRWKGPQLVLTHRPPQQPVPGIEFHTDLHDAVSAAKAAAGDRYVNVLGATVARACLDAGLLDEILVLVAPVMLGDGVALFERPGGTRVELERLKVSQSPGATHLWFRVGSAGRR